jgi:hypothetical protein
MTPDSPRAIAQGVLEDTSPDTVTEPERVMARAIVDVDKALRERPTAGSITENYLDLLQAVVQAERILDGGTTAKEQDS